MSGVERFAKSQKEKKEAKKKAIQLLKKLDKATYKVDSELMDKVRVRPVLLECFSFSSFHRGPRQGIPPQKFLR